jgi:EmrB/QacA subfamily drug resistance transporter
MLSLTLPQPSSASPGGGRATHRSRTVLAIMLATFLSAMEATIVATAMPTIVRELGGLSLYGWVGAAYLLAATVTVPLYGKLSDLYGRKPLMLFGLLAFLAGSVWCGMAGSIGALIAARALQGVGAGAIQPVSMTIVGDLFSLEERAKAQGAFGAVWGVAGVLGPLLGALMVSTVGWRWVFWINVPVGVGAAALLWVSYYDTHGPPPVRPKIDFAGAALLGASAVCILLAAGKHTLADALPLLAGAAVSVFAFSWVERRAVEPVVPPKLIADPSVWSALLSTVLLGAAMAGAVNYLPLFVQGVLGHGPAAAGAAITPMLVGWPIAAVITGKQLRRVGVRGPVILGSVLALLGIGLLSWNAERPTPSFALIYVSMLVFGAGMGVSNTALVISLQTNAGYKARGVVTALSMFGRSVGQALGAGGLGAVLVAGLSKRLDPHRVATLLNPEGRRAGLQVDAEALAALAASFHPLWWILAMLAAANLVLVFAVYRGTLTSPETETP